MSAWEQGGGLKGEPPAKAAAHHNEAGPAPKQPGGLADRAGFIILGNIAQSLAQMAVVMVLARLFSRADYGSYRQVWLVYWMLSPVLLLGIPSSILYFLPRLQPEQRRRFVLRTLGLLLVLGMVLCAVITSAAPRIAAWMHNPSLASLLRIFALYAIFALPAAALPNLLIAHGRHRAAAGIIAGFALLLGAGVITASALTAQVAWALRAAVGVAVLQALIAVAIVLRAHLVWPRAARPPTTGATARKTPWLDWSALKQQLTWAVPVGFSSVIAVLSRRAGHTIVAVTYPRAEYAIYDVGAFEVPFVGAFTFAVTQTLLPVFSGMHYRDQIGSLIRLWHESIRKVALLLFPLFVVLMICADQIVVILFSQRFAASTPIFRTYLLLLPLRTTNYSSVLQAAGDTKALAQGTTGALILVASLGVILAHSVGLVGPAIALVIASYAMTAFWLVRIRRTLGIPFRDTFPWARVGRISGLALVLGVPLLPLLRLGLGPWATVAIIIPTYAALYLAAVFKTGLLTRRDRELIIRWLSLSTLRRPPGPGGPSLEEVAQPEGNRPAKDDGR